MREPAKSCGTCRRALRSDEVLYAPTGELICKVCFPIDRPRLDAGAAPSWQAAMERRARTGQRRRLLTGIVFAWMVAGIFVAWQLHASLTIATIEASSSVPVNVRVAGHVVSGRLHRPLWLVGQSPERCPGELAFAARLVAHTDGAWDLPVRLDGHPGQIFLLAIVAADELADAALERGDAHAPEASRGQGTETTNNCPGAGSGLDLPPGSAVLASRKVTLAPTASLASRSTADRQ